MSTPQDRDPYGPSDPYAPRPEGTPSPSYGPPPPAPPAPAYGGPAYGSGAGYGAGYGAGSGGYPAARNGLGVSALVLGVVAVMTSWTVLGGVVLGVAAVVTGFLGRRRVRRGEATNGGVALGGILLGMLGTLLGVAVLAIALYAIYSSDSVQNLNECIQQAGSDQAEQQACADRFRDDVTDR